MSTLAVIPARLGATRLPRKPLRLLGGSPLVIRVWERTTAMRVAERVVIATDTAEVAAICRNAGAEVVMTRPDHPSGTDRVAEVSMIPEFSYYETIVNVQGDEPFMPERAIRGAVDLVVSGAFPLGTAAAYAEPDVLTEPSVVKVVVDDAGRALYFSRAPVPFLRDTADEAALAPLVRRHLGVYAYRRDALLEWVSLPPHALEVVERLEQLRPLAAGMAIGVHSIAQAAGGGIDTEEDLAIANATWIQHNGE